MTFSFNGGPGSSSVWLHLGVLGPRRVVLQEDGNLPKPPFQLADNEYSLLDDTDLVFIDPTNTGYSRPVEGVKPRNARLQKGHPVSRGFYPPVYDPQPNRWLSPKFLIGESYGTTRAAGALGLSAGAPRHVSERDHAVSPPCSISRPWISTQQPTCPISFILPGYPRRPGITI